MDFYEYGGVYNFYKNTVQPGNDSATLLGKITTNGWEGNVVGNLTGTAQKATADGNGLNIASNYAKLSGAIFAGAVTGPYYFATTKMSMSGGKMSNLTTQPSAGLFADGVVIANPSTINDQGWIRMLGASESSSTLEIATGDDGGTGEQIKVRQYNTSGVVNHELTLLDNSGNTAVSGNLTIGSATTDAQNTVKLVMNTSTSSLDFVFN